MKAVWTGTGIDIVASSGGPPPLRRPDDVRLRITAAGVCGTDVHIWEGRLSFVKPPIVLGHEFAGVVDECGPDVQAVKPGHRVKCDSVVGCGNCSWCKRGATQFCPNGAEFGITMDGGWSEWLIAPERNLHLLPEAISDEIAAVMDVEVMSALRKAAIRPGETIAIFGAGPAGLIAVQCARIRGARDVILCGTREERLALGMQLGADHVINVRTCNALERLLELTGGKGVDIAFDAAGTDSAIMDALGAVRPQGRVVLYGLPDRGISDFPVKDIVLKDMVVYGALPDRCGWDELIDLVASGRLNLHKLITHRFPLENAADALSAIRDRRDGAIKAVLQIGAEARAGKAQATECIP